MPGKGKDKSAKIDTPELPPLWAPTSEPLRCMDMFAGCGGLSEGLHQAGIATTKWAVNSSKFIPTAKFLIRFS